MDRLASYLQDIGRHRRAIDLFQARPRDVHKWTGAVLGAISSRPEASTRPTRRPATFTSSFEERHLVFSGACRTNPQAIPLGHASPALADRIPDGRSGRLPKTSYREGES